MKALRILDHAAPILARLFAIYSLGQGVMALWYFHIGYEPNFITPHLLVGVCLIAILWNACVWHLKSRLARICLGICSTFYLLLTLSALGHLFPLHFSAGQFSRIFASNFVLFGIPLLGYVAMIWTAVRSANWFSSSTPSALSSQAPSPKPKSPLFFLSFFKNPISSV